MKKLLLACCVFMTSLTMAQVPDAPNSYSDYVMPEILWGVTAEPNDSFPAVKKQKAILLSFGHYSSDKDHEWAYRLNYPRTGFTFSANDYGNFNQVGQSFSALSFIEFDMFRKKKKDLKMNIGLGTSYFNKRLTRQGNDVNKGVSTGLNWAFKVFFYYELLKSQVTTVRLGTGYFHHSNGHTRLPNQGFNSFLLSASAQIHDKKVTAYEPPDEFITADRRKIRQTYYDFRFGIGQHVLSEDFNDTREVFTAAVSMGQIVNKTYKFGGGIFYRFYEHYYDYIINEEALITEIYPYFKEAPISYASNFGIYGSIEFMLNHIAIEFNLGFNIHKPFYKIDYQLNQGVVYYIITGEGPVFVEELGPLDPKFERKRSILSRLGLKYYLIGNDKAPRHNVFLAATINANLGQADFSELSIGYMYGLEPKMKKRKKVD